MEKKIYYLYAINSLSDSILQILIYLMFFKANPIIGLTYIFISRYTLNILLLPIFNQINRKLKIHNLGIIYIILLILLLSYPSNIGLLIIAFSMLFLITSIINIKIKGQIHHLKKDKKDKFAKLQFLSSSMYLISSIIILMLDSKIEQVLIILLILGILGLWIQFDIKNLFEEYNISRIKDKSLFFEVFKLSKVIYIILLISIIYQLIDTFELEYIVKFTNHSEKLYPLIVLISSFSYILSSYIIQKINNKYDYSKMIIIGLIICSSGYLYFTFAKSFFSLSLSMSIIAFGITLYTTYFNSYIAKKYEARSEEVFWKIGYLQNIVMTLMFLITNLYLRNNSLLVIYRLTAVVLIIFIVYLSYKLIKCNDSIFYG